MLCINKTFQELMFKEEITFPYIWQKIYKTVPTKIVTLSPYQFETKVR